MNLADLALLVEWSRMQLAIAKARRPDAIMDISEEAITKSLGYKKLREWYGHLSPLARTRARRWMRGMLDALRPVLLKVEATGDLTPLADLEISYIDASGGEIAPIKVAQDAATPTERIAELREDMHRVAKDPKLTAAQKLFRLHSIRIEFEHLTGKPIDEPEAR